jgi:Ca-activated chloride channel family protein
VPSPALACFIAVLLCARIVAQQPPVTDNRLFQSGIEITSITATVIDAEGHPVTGLDRGAFEVYEDGVRQTVTQFTRERVPIGLGVLLDISDSMFGKRMDDARAAVDKFLFELLDPADEFFLSAFNHRPHPLTGWTREQGDVRHALAGLRPSGGTAIYDAILDALPLIDKRTRQRAAILVISDGADTASSATLRELRPALRRSDTFVYAIAIDSPERQPINTRVNPAALREITAESGGRTEIVQNSAQLDEAAARIAEELNSQYVLGYTPPRGADNQFHSLRVRIAGSDDRVRARSGYVATPAGRPRSRY